MARDPDVPLAVQRMRDRLLYKALLFLFAAAVIAVAAALVHLALGLLVVGVTAGFVAAKL